MNVQRIVTGAFRENAWLVDCGGGDAAIVDPGAEPQRLADMVRQAGLTLRAVLLTHGHIDHVSALPCILEAFPGVPVWLGRADAAWCFSPGNAMPPYEPVLDIPPTLQRLDGGETVRVGSVAFSVLHTPGHSPGSVCYFVDDEDRPILFSGDTLFAQSVGRTDFAGGSADELSRSLCRLAELPADTAVLPGHGPLTTIGRETRDNQWMVEAMHGVVDGMGSLP